jgi:hypothetical protein
MPERRARRAARHRDQVAGREAVATWQQTQFHLLAAAAAGLLDTAAPAHPDGGPELTADQRTAAQEVFRARVRTSRDPEAQRAALDRVRAAQARLSPHRDQPAGDDLGHDGGSPRKPENSVAAKIAETGSDLRRSPDETRAQPPSDTPDLGLTYEQRNNPMQRRMRVLDETRRITGLRSLRRCGAEPLAGAVAITRKVDGSGGFAGMFRCGSVWACPECSPVVRTDRAALMEAYALAWAIEHDAELCTGDVADRGRTHAGHGMVMATLTSRHAQHAVLEDRTELDAEGQPVLDKDGRPVVRRGQLQRTADAWRRMLQSRWWRGFCERYGIAGGTRALEVTHSWHASWHTHIHAVLWLEEPATDRTAAAMEAELYERWQAECAHAKLGRPSRKHGVKVDPARRGAEGAADLARYLVKVQDKDDGKTPGEAPPGQVPDHISKDARPTADQARRLADARTRRDAARAAGNVRAEAEADSLIASIRQEIGRAHASALGNELLRADTKRGRREGRAPFEILRLALAGDDAELQLWRQYERATKGSRMLTWTGGIRARLERLTGQDLRDEQQVVLDQDAADVADILVTVEPQPWRETVAAVPGRRGQLRVAVTVASAHALKVGTDPTAHARQVVRDVLESWGLAPGVHFHGPGDARLADPLTGEVPRESWTDPYTGRTHTSPPPARTEVVPPPRREPRHHQWQTTHDLTAATGLTGIRPRDWVRPEQARRRAAGLPIARDPGAVTGTSNH